MHANSRYLSRNRCRRLSFRVSHLSRGREYLRSKSIHNENPPAGPSSLLCYSAVSHRVSHTRTHTRAHTRAPVYARECWHLWKRTVLHPFDTCEKSFSPFSPFFLSPAFSRAAHLLPSHALSLVVSRWSSRSATTTTVTIVVPTTACTIQRNAIVRGLFLVLARFELILRLLVIFFSRSPLSFARYLGDVWHFPFAVSHSIGGLVQT